MRCHWVICPAAEVKGRSSATVAVAAANGSSPVSRLANAKSVTALADVGATFAAVLVKLKRTSANRGSLAGSDVLF